LFPAVLAFAFVLLQSSFSFAGTKNDVDEELSPYKWGHWDRMVPPAAGPVALAPAPLTAVLPSADPIVPPDPPIPTPPEPPITLPTYEPPLNKPDAAPPSVAPVEQVVSTPIGEAVDSAPPPLPVF
jgi:hypothetical protein